jgi:uncharacterized protein YkwD/DNA-directed RNA polymerase subunit RPC12/RpoP
LILHPPEDDFVIRFACPRCKQVLKGRAEQAGKSLACPKCGQRLQVPRVQEPAETVRPQTKHPRPRSAARPFLAVVIAVAGLLLLIGAGAGVWLLIFSDSQEAEPVARVAPSQPAVSTRTKPRTTETAKEPKPKPREEPKPSEETPPEPKPPEPKPPVVEEPPPSFPSPAREKKEIALAEELPPELNFDFVDAVNAARAKEGREPIFLDAELSRDCRKMAERLARLGPPSSNRPAAEKDGANVVAADAPLEAVAKWLQEPARRALILEPRLRTFAAGFARNSKGQWISVFDWTSGIDRDPPMETAPITGAIVYPAPGQLRVPLWFPGNEVPDPLPQVKNKLAGYPITLSFPPHDRLKEVTARLASKKERAIDVWLSTPEKPANPNIEAWRQQNTICLIAKKPLEPNVRYRVEISAKVNGKPWSARWDFSTVSEGEIHHRAAGTLLRRLNAIRCSAGLPPVPLDAERSKPCAAHARYLELNAPTHPDLNWNDEKADLPGYSPEGAAVARRVAIQGGGGPIEAVNGLIDSIISRPYVLDPQLREMGLGYTPFPLGGWVWVIELRRVPGRQTADKECLYPAVDQREVPLVYPAKERPSPIPAESKERTAGYAITATFLRPVRIESATAKLVDDKGRIVDGWLSTPDKPAIAGRHQTCLCFLPKKPLAPDTRYTMTFQAEVNAARWERTWSFTTLAQPDRFADDLETKILSQVNAVRRTAGLSPVRLDSELSRVCQSHARYLAINESNAPERTWNVHTEDPKLPGATPEGARAAKASVIAVVLDPQTCVEGWMATLYHRIPILRPDLERVGFGHARLHGRRWACVLDTGTGRASRPSANRSPSKRKTP